MKIAFVDVETSGLDPNVNSIHELGIIVDIDGKFKGKFHANMKPEEPENLWDMASFDSTGTDPEKVKLYPPADQIYPDLIAFLESYVNKFDRNDKLFFIAYNALFDMNFLRSFFTRRGDNFFGSWFWFPPICIMIAFAFISMEMRANIPNFKLSSIARIKEIVVDENEAHKAMYDVRLVRSIFYSM